MSFEALKKNRKSAIDKLLSEAQASTGGGKSYGDDRFWKPTVDKAGNGFAVIRFLPAADADQLPWTQYWDHGFKGPTGRWYIERSLTSIGQDDPVSEANSALWNTGTERNKEIARSRKRRLHYVSNILVITDTAAPENEGKVFLFQYGKKIFEKIMDVMQPQFEDETPINPFDFWDGANFKLKIRQVEGYRNYDKSEFDKAEALFEGDEKKLKAIYKELHSLAEFTDPAKYKSYAELAKKLAEVLGEEQLSVRESVTKDAPESGSTKDDEEDEEGIKEFSPGNTRDDDEDEDEDDEDEDDKDMTSFFKNLAKDKD